MITRTAVTICALCIFSAAAVAAEAIVISYDKATMKLLVKQDGKERTLELKRTTHVHDVDDSEIEVDDRAANLKKGTVIDIKENKTRIVEINIKKKP